MLDIASHLIDVDGLYDGQEITCRIEPGAEPDEVFVFVWLHSDPNGDDSDGDGIPDEEDTAPFTKHLSMQPNKPTTTPKAEKHHNFKQETHK